MDVVLGLRKTLWKRATRLVPGASFSNLSRYRVNFTEHVKLKGQVNLKLSSAEAIESTSVNKTIDESPMMMLLMV